MNTRLLPPPFADVLAAVDLTVVRVLDLAAMGAGMLAGWWLYVPLHELLHALGCLGSGGSVSRLEVAPIYGGGVLAALFPWVAAVDGPYAGRLVGFDTRGSDLVYLATVLAPFALALFPGVWLLRRAARRRRALGVGFAVPFAVAPWLSLTGDAYEIGSILVTRLPPWRALGELLRGDDLFLRWEAVVAAGAGNSVVAGLVLSAALGLGWALATSAVAGQLAARPGGEPPLSSPTDPVRSS